MPSVLAPHHSSVFIDIKTLNPEELRYQICMFLSQWLKNGSKLRKSALAQTAETFGRKKESIWHLWRKHKNANCESSQVQVGCEKENGRWEKTHHKSIWRHEEGESSAV